MRTTNGAAGRSTRTAGQIETIALVSGSAQAIALFRASLIRELVDTGRRVLALAPDYTPEQRESVRALGAEPIDFSLDRAGLRPLRDLHDTIALARLLRRLRPDAVLCSFAKPVIFGMIAARIAGVPRRIAMLEGLGYLFAQGEKPTLKRQVIVKLSLALYALAFRIAHRILFLNREDLEQLAGLGVLPRAKAINIGGIGVDLDAFQPAEASTNPVSFLLVARLLRAKGIVEYAEAARLVKQQAPDAHFYLLGATDDNPSALSENEVRAWSDAGVLEWKGHVSDVRPWIAKASVLVLPSFYREGVPRGIQEAMAMARPIITTDNVGCRDTVEEGVNGYLVPIRDVPALAEAMMRFVRAPETLVPMGQASRRMAERDFDARKKDQQILQMLTATDIGSTMGA